MRALDLKEELNPRRFPLLDHEDFKYFTDEELFKYVQNKIIPRLLKDCEQWFNEVGTKPFFRGEKVNHAWFIGVPRQDRKPKDTEFMFHEIIDEYLKNHNFEARRGNSIFVTPEYGDSLNFGRPYVIFPIEDYSYTWHPNIQDFTQLQNKFFRQHAFFKYGIHHIVNIPKSMHEEAKEYADKERETREKNVYRIYDEELEKEKIEKEIKSLPEYWKIKYRERLYKLIREHLDTGKLDLNKAKVAKMMNFDKFKTTDVIQATEQEVLIHCRKYHAVSYEIYNEYLKTPLEYALT